MLFVPYSSTIATMLCRIPVNIDATTIAVITPTTIPRIVRNAAKLVGPDAVQRHLYYFGRNDVETLIMTCAVDCLQFVRQACEPRSGRASPPSMPDKGRR